MPVGITVEGANILTRSLITFAQGALRAHPYLYKEVVAVQEKDSAKGFEMVHQPIELCVGVLEQRRIGFLQSCRERAHFGR